MAAEDVETTLDRLLRAAVRHQLRRPKLARMLEYADAVLPLEEETKPLNAAILQRVAAFLTHAGLEDAAGMAGDLVAALRGMAGETDQEALLLRSGRLARGYFGMGPSPAADD